MSECKKIVATALCTMAFGVIILISPARANLIINGSFEEPDITTGTFGIFMNISGWNTTFGPGIEIQDNVAGSPFSGNQHVELDSNTNSGMSQIISTNSGQSYYLQFAYSPRPGVSAESNTIEVLFNGTLLTTLAQSGINLLDTSWTVFNFDVIALGTSSTLEFRAAGTGESLGGYLDDVQLSQVAEPRALILLGLGLAISGRWLRREKR